MFLNYFREELLNMEIIKRKTENGDEKEKNKKVTLLTPNVPEWRNWQTHWTQNPAEHSVPCGFESLLRHTVFLRN